MICSNCVRMIPDDSKFCPHCGSLQNTNDNVADSILEQAPASQGKAENTVDELSSGSPSGFEDEPVDSGSAEDFSWGSSGPQLKPPGFSLFSPNGRLNRLKYVYFFLFDLLGLVLLSAGLAYAQIAASTNSLGPLVLMLYYPIMITLIAIRIITMVKRFHDINQPGYHFFTLLIPFYNLYVLFKLFFIGPSNEINTYGGNERKSWYWQVPLTVLLVPLLYFAASFGITQGRELLMSSAHEAKGQYYYNGQYGVGITFPPGWAMEDMDGYLKGAKNWNGDEIITLQATDANEEPFDQYTDKEFSAVVEHMGEAEYFTQIFQFDSDAIYDLTCVEKDINGKRFLQMEFRHFVKTMEIRHLYFMGIYDSKLIIIQVLMPESADTASLDTMIASAESLLIGDSAAAEDAKKD